MYRFKRLLVGVSLNEQDGTSIRYASMISRLAKSEEIIFLYVANNAEIDEEICEIYPELKRSCDVSTSQEIEKLVKEHYAGHPDTTLTYKAVEGSPLIEFLKWSKEDGIDLIIMRKRRGDKTIGTLVKKSGANKHF